jgi:hypothetical protein
LFANSTGNNNTVLGSQALISNISGSNNTVVGYASGSAITSGSKNTIIGGYTGNNGGLDIRTASNHIVLSDGDGNPRGIFDGSGNFLVNTTSQILSGKTSIAWNANSYNGIVLSETDNVSGTTFMIFAEGTTICGGVYRVGATSAVAFTTTSDYRLKTNVQPMTGALAKVAQLKPVTYDWIAGGSSQGFIAHELQAVIPDAVTNEKDAVDKDGNPKYQGVDTSYLVATLTAAIQELKAEFDAYKATHP